MHIHAVTILFEKLVSVLSARYLYCISHLSMNDEIAGFDHVFSKFGLLFFKRKKI